MVFKPRILKRVTVPVLKMRPNRPYYLRFTEAVHIGKEIANSPIKSKEPAKIVNCFNYETQEICQVICRTVMLKELDEAYPGDAYVNKSFEIIMQNHSDPQKRYKLFTISEIAEPSPEDFSPVDYSEDDPQDSQGEPSSDESDMQTRDGEKDYELDLETGELVEVDELGVSELTPTRGKNGKRKRETVS